MWYLAILAANKKHKCSYSTHLVYQSLLSFIFFSFSFFFFFLNSCYNANLVCSIDTVATVLWFQHLHSCCFLCFSFIAFFSSLFFFLCFFGGNIVLSTLLFFFYFLFFLYIKLLVNTINCYNIFTIVDMLIPQRLK